MKILILLLPLICLSNAFSKGINLEVTSSVKLEKKTERNSSTLRVEFNKEFTLPSQTTKILMRIEELKGLSRGPGGERAVLVSAEIYHLNGKDLELVSRPNIITNLGKEATFTTTDYEGREVKLTVKPSATE